MCWTALGLAVWLSACSASEPPVDARTFELRHLDGQQAAEIIKPYVYDDREKSPGSFSYTDQIITVRETPDNLDKIARVLTEHDRPKPTVRLHFKVIAADGPGRPDSAIADIEAELRKLFRFQGYRLVAEAFVGGREGSHITQEIAGEGGSYGLLVGINQVRGTPDSGSVQLGVQLSTAFGGSLQTSVNARAGQTIILGNAQISDKGGTVILAVRPELVGG
jgi:hypothetical protein